MVRRIIRSMLKPLWTNSSSMEYDDVFMLWLNILCVYCYYYYITRPFLFKRNFFFFVIVCCSLWSFSLFVAIFIFDCVCAFGEFIKVRPLYQLQNLTNAIGFISWEQNAPATFYTLKNIIIKTMMAHNNNNNEKKILFHFDPCDGFWRKLTQPR